MSTPEIEEAERMQQWGKAAFLRSQLPPEQAAVAAEEPAPAAPAEIGATDEDETEQKQ